MKKQGVLNAQLSGYIAALGHMDTFLIGDAGMPVPPGVPIVDLAVCGGVPAFTQVLDTILQEAEIEQYTVADELAQDSPLLAHIRAQLPHAVEASVPHSELKALSAKARFAVRTGEFTPYANVILRAGVAFHG